MHGLQRRQDLKARLVFWQLLVQTFEKVLAIQVVCPRYYVEYVVVAPRHLHVTTRQKNFQILTINDTNLVLPIETPGLKETY